MQSKNGQPSKSGLTISTSLFQRISESDAPAWATFVQIYGPVVYRWCRKDGLSDVDAADVGQDVFRAVSTSIHSFERTKSSNFLGWLRTITRFKVADHFRQSAQVPQAIGGTAFLAVMSSLTDQTDRNDPARPVDDDFFIDDEDSDEARELVTQSALDLIKDRFSPKAWSAFWETAVNGRTAQDVGGDLGMSAMAVRKAKSRVLHRLKNELSDISESLFK